jgi:Domain of unknown function (DUF4401)
MALKPSLRDVLSLLREQGALAPDAEPRAMTAMEAYWRSAAATPWYVRVLIGFGAWLAACFLIGFFALLLQPEDEMTFFILGLILCGATSGLRRGSGQIFLSQLCLAFCLAGQALFLGGFAELTESASATALGVLLLELALLFLYPDLILRFLATMGAALALLFLAYQPRILALVDLTLAGFAALLHLLFLHHARLQHSRWRELLSPVSFALAIVFLGALLGRCFVRLGPEFRLEGSESPLAILTLALAAVTMYSAARVLQELGIEVSGIAGATVFASLGLTALLTLNTPGVVAAAGVLALAFHRRNVVMLGLAVAFLIGFGVLYYYDLSLSLLAKSGALLGSGLVLLGLRLFILRRFPAAPAEVP